MKPRLTDRVLRGIVAAAAPILAGGPAEAFGNDTPETRKAWDDVAVAKQWANEMQEYRRLKKMVPR